MEKNSNKKPIISIIMPVHNGGEYLREALESLPIVNGEDVELICVDDESSDNSLEVIRDYAKEREYVQIVSQKKSNAGMARNLGINLSKGDYLLFLDADDIFYENLIPTLLFHAKDAKTDVIVFDAESFDSNTGETINNFSAIRYLPDGKCFFSPEEIGSKIFDFTIPAPWNKLISKRLISENEIKYQSIESANDLAFVYQCIALANTIEVIGDKLIKYRVNNSSSISISRTKWTNSFCAVNYLSDELCKRGLLERYRGSIKQLFARVVISELVKLDKVDYDNLFNDEYYRKVAKKLVFINPTSLCDEEIVIYGAGEKTKVLIGLLLYFKIAAHEKITIVSTFNDEASIMGIPIKKIDELKKPLPDKIYICASKINSVESMRSKAVQLGVKNIVIVAETDIIDLINFQKDM